MAFSSSISLELAVEGRLARVEVREDVAGAPAVERRFEAVDVVVLAPVPVRVVVAEGRVEAVVPDIDVRDPIVDVLVPVAFVELIGLRTVPVAPATVLLSAALGLDDVRVLVRLAAVEVRVGFLSSSLALTLGRLRWLEVVEVAVVGRRAVVVVVGGRVGGLVSPPVARVPATVLVPDRDEAVDPVAAARLAAAAVVVDVALARLAAGEVDAVLALDGVSGDIASVAGGATSGFPDTSTFSFSTMVT